jgi:hypothetical protein|tara:strand:- start:1354 stop:1764 length:411 start_codon:yes stop_codon:yes gene_type:complete
MAVSDTTELFESTVYDPTGPIASGDLSALRFHAVKPHGTTDNSVVGAGAGAGYGLLANSPTTGLPAKVAIGGVFKARMGATPGTVKKGTFLKSDASHELVAADTDEDLYVCMSLQDDPAAAELCIVLVGTGYYAVA